MTLALTSFRLFHCCRKSGSAYLLHVWGGGEEGTNRKEGVRERERGKVIQPNRAEIVMVAMTTTVKGNLFS